MNCEQTRNWLLHSEDARPQACASAEVAEHLSACDACWAFAAELTSLEKAWREQPAPAESEPARLAFLGRLTAPLEASATARAASRVVRFATAALLLFVIGAVVWTLAPTPQAYASPTLIEELVNWNLTLAQAPDQTERTRIYAEKQDHIKRASQSAKLSPEEQELVGLLIETGSWLSTNNDPVDTAERFSVVADKLVERLEVAAKGNDLTAVNRYAKLQGMVNERGVSAQLTKAEESGALNFDKERRIEKVVLRDSKRMHTLVDLLERDPDLSRKDIRQAMNIPQKTGKNTAGLAFDLEVPALTVVVGQSMSCAVRLHNSGPALHKLQVLVTLRDDTQVIDAHAPTGHRQEGSQVIFRQLATLPRGGDAAFEINIKAARSELLKCRAEVRAKQLGDRPIWREQLVTIVDSNEP